VRAHERVGVLARRKLHDERGAAGGGEDVDRFRGRSTARGVRIEAHEDPLGILAEFGCLIGREGRAERCDRVGEASFVERDAIEITFDDDERFALCGTAPRDIEGVEPAAFGIDGRRARVEVFGLLIVERATAEGDASTLVASVGSMSQPRLKTK